MGADALTDSGVTAVIDDPGNSHALATWGLGQGWLRIHDPMAKAPKDLAVTPFRSWYGGVAVLLEAAPP